MNTVVLTALWDIKLPVILQNQKFSWPGNKHVAGTFLGKPANQDYEFNYDTRIIWGRSRFFCLCLKYNG